MRKALSGSLAREIFYPLFSGALVQSVSKSVPRISSTDAG